MDWSNVVLIQGTVWAIVALFAIATWNAKNMKKYGNTEENKDGSS